MYPIRFRLNWILLVSVEQTEEFSYSKDAKEQQTTTTIESNINKIIKQTNILYWNIKIYDDGEDEKEEEVYINSSYVVM